MSLHTLLFIWLSVTAIRRLIRSRSEDPLKPVVVPPRAKAPMAAPTAMRPPFVLRSRIYMPAGLLSALERADRLDEPWAVLPPGRRDAELETLLEWIANARPDETLEIVSEIRRHYYNTGDKEGGDALRQALRKSLKAKSMAEREAILQQYEPYTRQARIPHLWIEEAQPHP